eukprot:g15590.t1
MENVADPRKGKGVAGISQLPLEWGCLEGLGIWEAALRFSRGVGTTEIAWIDSIVKLMRMHGPSKTKKATNYVSERLKWFFGLQKEAVLEFMLTVSSSCDGHLHSRLLSEKGLLIENNPTIKKLIFERYDKSVANHQQLFHSLVTRTIDSTC